MPHSFFTRLLGIVIAVASCAPLFLEINSAGSLFMGALPLLCALFMWRVMREAPVFDDQAFHRTLPPRDGSIFLRQLRAPLGVLAGVALVIVGRCVFYNYGWRTMVLGTLQVAGPAFFMMMAFGVAAVAESGRQGRGIWGWLAVVVPVALSTLAVAKLRENEGGSRFLMQFSLLLYGRLLLPAGLAYLPLWWLIAARRRRVAGMMLAAALGLALPWFYADEIQRMNDSMWTRGSSAFAALTHLKYPDVAKAPQLVRKAWPQGRGAGEDEAPMSGVLEVTGMKDNEALSLGPVVLDMALEMSLDYRFQGDGLRLRPVQKIEGKTYAGWSNGVMAANTSAGGTMWGRQSEMAVLGRQLPAGMNLGHWDERNDWAAPIMVGSHAVDLGAEMHRDKEIPRPEEVALRTWVTRGGVLHFGKPEIFEADAPGRRRLPWGGVLEVKPLNLDGRYPGVELDYHLDSVHVGGDPWFHLFPQGGFRMLAPYVVVVDEAGKEAWLVEDMTPDPEMKLRGTTYPLSLVGRESVFVVGADRLEGETGPDLPRKLRLLPRCKLYVYWPEFTPLPGWTLPPLR